MTLEDNNNHSEKLMGLLESLLFVADEPATVAQLAEALQAEEAEIEEALDYLEGHYKEAENHRGLRLQRKGGRVQLVTAPEAAPHVERFLGVSLGGRLTAPALETLAIVAYRQPITRPEIEAIRGVNSDGVLRTLVGRGLVEEVGRLETVGRPVLYGTTFEFLGYFGLGGLNELPQIEEGAETG